MVEAEGKFLRQYQGKGYIARVTIQVQSDLNGPQIDMDCAGRQFSSQGQIEEATATGYTDWKQGAEAGVRYALKKAHQSSPVYALLAL